MRLGLLRAFLGSLGTALATTHQLELTSCLCCCSKRRLLLSLCPSWDPGDKGPVASLLTPPRIEPGHGRRAGTVLQWHGNTPCPSQKGPAQLPSASARGHTG